MHTESTTMQSNTINITLSARDLARLASLAHSKAEKSAQTAAGIDADKFPRLHAAKTRESDEYLELSSKLDGASFLAS
jgi:hypothetical protein